MSSVKFYNPQAFDKATKRFEEKRRKAFVKACDMAVEYIFNHTPVWSGNTLANYKFTSGRPSVAYRAFNQELNKQGYAIKDPENEYGEINRDEAERISRTNYARAVKDPNKPFIVTNNTVYKDWQTGEELTFADLEHGNLSKRVPAGGIFYGAQKYISAFLKVYGK